MRTLGVVRQTIGAALYPVQVVAMLPRDAFFAVTDYFGSLTQLQNETARMRDRLTRVNAGIATSVGMDLWNETQAELGRIRAKK